jgi:hypothetical protein
MFKDGFMQAYPAFRTRKCPAPISVPVLISSSVSQMKSPAISPKGAKIALLFYQETF